MAMALSMPCLFLMKSQMTSPKGRFRMWHFGLLALVFMGLSANQSAVTEYVWLWETINLLGKIGLGVTALYYGGKELTHSRTHELEGQEKRNREIALLITWGLVLCGIFASS